MLIRGVSGLGLLTLVVAVAGCSGSAPSPVRGGAAVAVPGYDAPPQAPDFCAGLAGSTHLAEIPAAVGQLAVDQDSASAVGELEGAIADLEVVLDDVADDDGNADLTAALEDLLASVHAATRNPVDDGLRDRLSSRLDALGDAVQPQCEFPT
jgi:hypothetical protein